MKNKDRKNESGRRIVMKKYAFGVDIGGTTVKMGFFSVSGELLDKWEIKTDTSDAGKNILPDIAASIKDKLEADHIAAEEVSGIGMGIPGPVDDEGNVLKCVNLGWGVFNVEKEMTDLTGIPAKAGNDANVAALGEMYQGGGKGYSNVVMVTLGTGVGGGIILNGKILSGTHGAAGEIGHFPVNDEETECCGCGKKGCLEQYASANGIARVARQRLAATEDETVLRSLETVTSKDIFDAAKEGDAFSLQLVDDLGRMIGKACANIAIVVDPEIFVIGGGVSKAGAILTDVIEKYYKEYAFHASRETRISLATLGNDAGIFGGVKMVL